MAYWEINSPTEILKQLELAGKSETVIPAMLNAAAKPMKRSIVKRVSVHDREGAYQHLSQSVEMEKAKRNKNGDWVCKVVFKGYDKTRKPTKEYPKGTPHTLKAAGLEYGNSHEAARPFLTTAVKDAEPEILEALQYEYNKGISQ